MKPNKQPMDIRMFSAKFFFFFEIFLLLYFIIEISYFGYEGLAYHLFLTQPGVLILLLFNISISSFNILFWLIVSLTGLLLYLLIGYIYGMVIDVINKHLNNKISIISGIVLLSLIVTVKMIYQSFHGGVPLIPWPSDLVQYLFILVPAIIFIIRYREITKE